VSGVFAKDFLSPGKNATRNPPDTAAYRIVATSLSINTIGDLIECEASHS